MNAHVLFHSDSDSLTRRAENLRRDIELIKHEPTVAYHSLLRNPDCHNLVDFMLRVRERSGRETMCRLWVKVSERILADRAGDDHVPLDEWYFMKIRRMRKFPSFVTLPLAPEGEAVEDYCFRLLEAVLDGRL